MNTNLFVTNIGSHIWKMNHQYSDIDKAFVYIMDSRDCLLGINHKGKQILNGEQDDTIFEIGHVIDHLISGNLNFLLITMSPIVIEQYGTALHELRDIVRKTISKASFHSINGIALNMLKDLRREYATKPIFKKKLNIAARNIQFGIRLFEDQEFAFEKTDVKEIGELEALIEKLKDARDNSSLPEAVDRAPFDEYLIQWRLKKMKIDGVKIG